MTEIVFIVIIGDMYNDSTTIHSVHKDEDNATKIAQELESSLRGTETVTIETFNLEE